MPRKKHRQEKRLIATRLTEIRQQVEEYIYEQKHISQNTCEAYLREVSSYTVKCGNDARLLQAIQRITRIMKGIIAEQQQLSECQVEPVEPDVTLLCDSTNGNSGELSPVYSTADEELTYSLIDDNTEFTPQTHQEICPNAYIQNNQKPEASENLLSDINITRHHNKEKLNDEMQVTDSYDETEESVNTQGDVEKLINQNRPNSPIRSECNIRRALSNLSIREDAAMATFTQECSQSILDNFDPWINVASQPVTLEATLTQDYNDVIKTDNIQNADTYRPLKNKSINLVTMPSEKVSQTPLTESVPDFNIIRDEVNNKTVQNFNMTRDEVNKATIENININRGEVDNKTVQNFNMTRDEVNKATIENININRGEDDNKTVQNFNMTRDEVNKGTIQNFNITRDEVIKGTIQNFNITRDEVIKKTVQNFNINRDEVNKGTVQNFNINRGEVNKKSVQNFNIARDEVNKGTIQNFNITRSEVNNKTVQNLNITRSEVNKKTVHNFNITRDEVNKGTVQNININRGEVNKKSVQNFNIARDEVNKGTIQNFNITRSEVNNKTVQNLNITRSEVNKKTVHNFNITRDEVNKGTVQNININRGEVNKKSVQNFNIARDEVNKGTIQNFNITRDEVNKGTIQNFNITRDEVNKGTIQNFNIARDEVNKGTIQNIHITRGKFNNKTVQNLNITRGEVNPETDQNLNVNTVAVNAETANAKTNKRTKNKPDTIESTKHSDRVTKKTNKKNDKAKLVENKPKVPKLQVKKTKRATKPKQGNNFSDTTEPNDNSDQARNPSIFTNETNLPNLKHSAYIHTLTNIGVNANLPHIHNQIVYDDLSWVDNIQFVREVSPEEYISITTDTDFWENHTLPQFCNDADFNI